MFVRCIMFQACSKKFYFSGEGKGLFREGKNNFWGSAHITMHYRKMIATKWCLFDFSGAEHNKIWGQLPPRAPAFTCLPDMLHVL